MEDSEDDFVVVIVKDEDTDSDNQNALIEIKREIDNEEENKDTLPLEELIKNVKVHGKHIDLVNAKEEPKYEDYQYEYIEDNLLLDDAEEYVHDADYIPEQHIDMFLEQDIDDSDNEVKGKVNSKYRHAKKKPCQRNSLVKDLIKAYPKFKTDQQGLIATLVEIMRSIKAPPLPNDYFIMNYTNFECSKCGTILETIAGISRHYQEKHGKRYLNCFACGVDFRSTTNLYKHEKRCIAPDAVLVLKARAIFLGRKGRSRPYLHYNLNKGKKTCRGNYSQNFCCDQCPAVFRSKIALVSHYYHHQGIRPFQCKECPSAYTSSSALTRHEKKHSNLQYICDHCGRTFELKTTLSSHMDTHRPLKKYACNECDRRYAQKSALLLHINREHRNLPPPCACQICPKRYPRMSLLKIHMRNAHGMLLMTRKMFFKSAPTMTNIELEKAKVVLKSEVIVSEKTSRVNNLQTESHNNNYVVQNKQDETTSEANDPHLTKLSELLTTIHEDDSGDVRIIVVENKEFNYENEEQVIDDAPTYIEGDRKFRKHQSKKTLKKTYS